MAKTKYAGVYVDNNGKYFYEVDLGTDRITGKRLRKKGRKNQQGKKFVSAQQAYKELIRIKNESLSTNGYANYNMTYELFMNSVYIPAYKADVEESTFYVREKTLENIRDRFAKLELRSITIRDIQQFRTWLLSENGAGYSQAYASLVFGMFRKSLEMAVEMQFLEQNISKKVKAIPKGKSIVPYWTKTEFEKVISKICLDDFYEHLCFVLLWVYFMTGVRVSEGTALWWEDVDFKNKRLRVHHTMFMKNKSDWTRKNYTKTTDGKRIISLDDDTLKILKEWKMRQAEIGIHDFIFSYDGKPMIKSTISRIIDRYAKLAGIHRIQAKGLRHSHASYLINEFNVSVLILSKRMGHSSPDITLKHYSHMWSGIDELIAEEMTGNIQFQPALTTKVHFNGNQTIKK
ncbi:tyrosine-type recombinase/integrase [Enterococcus faecalis]|uniref:tyrosine-type recombinase/integrase n=1 Tax=Enterococcus faecalis TaxID=1351 RepID=UPI002543CADE|nr:site-specific integrase [Enterococcus faecalis]MDK4396675.1 site-specific integrase [Enterococcus faecalis]MDK4415203.1 site-specific integrase [Enterococcus faecalis]